MPLTWTLLLGTALAAPIDLAPTLEDARGASPLELASPSGDWQTDLARAVVRAERAEPAAVAALRALQPVPTRAGTLRMVGAVLGVDVASPVLAARLTVQADPAERRALADALPRTGGDWPLWTAKLASTEDDPSVRAVLLESLERAPGSTALPVLVSSLTDDSAAVRAAAVRTLADHEAGPAEASHLMARLLDDDATVRAEASRSLGWFRYEPAWSALEARVTDDDPTVRLRALRALQRIDSRRAAASAAVQAATGDLDPKVARAAQQITA